MRFIKFVKCSKKNLSPDVEIAFWEPGRSAAFVHWSQTKPGTCPLVWFDSLWGALGLQL